MPLLRLERVEARYGSTRALHDVSLTVEEAEVVAVLGANGAGKTTTLRAVSGTVRRRGEILFAGKRIHGRGPEDVARLGVAHVPEGRGTFAELSVRDNLRLGAYARRGRLPRDRYGRVLDLFPWMRERERQQAGTLMQRPRLLLLDEPSLGLAPTVVREIFRVIGGLSADEGLAVLVVEQNAAVALDTAARAYVLEVGRVVLEGPSAQLRRDDAVRRSYLGY